MKQERACRRHVVLLGVGHTNGHIVRMWAMNPLPDTDLTCISDSGVATYSGYLPAVLAGQLPPEAMEIDLVRLCAAAGARLITERVTGLDRGRRELLFDDRPPVPYDVLSIGVGSVPQMPADGSDSTNLIPIKPMRSFGDRLAAVVERCERGEGPLQIVVVGGGAAGVEVSQCLPARLATLTSRGCQVTLVNRHGELLLGCAPSTTNRVLSLMNERGHVVLNHNSVTRVDDHSVTLQTGKVLSADVVIWATAATAPPLLSVIDLPKDDRGFLLTDDTLRSTSADPVFAVGDTGTIDGIALPKAGVYAVRQGPVLWDNIRRQLDGRALRPYRPQRSFLKLLNMGDGRAVGEWHGFTFAGHWVMTLKQRIDQKFMDMYQQLPDRMSMQDNMPCRGCGCKLGGDALAAGLGDTRNVWQDDATLLTNAESTGATDDINASDLLVTTDFFAAPFADAWLTGRIAAVHAASDIYAMGARPFAAEAIVVLPEGDEETQRKLLHDFQAGAAAEFKRMGATITGGHTITGPRFEVGFTVFGRPMAERLIRKQGMCPGDRLFLTQPLGTGLLMAALMRGQCLHQDYFTMIDTMLRGSQDIASIAVDCGVASGTDVTGFGLLGHLQEMVTDDVSVTLWGDAIPLLPGVREAAARGIASSLLPSNRHYLQGVASNRTDLDLFLDPQTCGGLLLAVPAERAAEFVQQCAQAGVDVPVEIGVVQSRKGLKRVVVE